MQRDGIPPPRTQSYADEAQVSQSALRTTRSWLGLRTITFCFRCWLKLLTLSSGSVEIVTFAISTSVLLEDPEHGRELGQLTMVDECGTQTIGHQSMGTSGEMVSVKLSSDTLRQFATGPKGDLLGHLSQPTVFYTRICENELDRPCLEACQCHARNSGPVLWSFRNQVVLHRQLSVQGRQGRTSMIEDLLPRVRFVGDTVKMVVSLQRLRRNHDIGWPTARFAHVRR